MAEAQTAGPTKEVAVQGRELQAPRTQEPTKEFRLKTGFRHWVDGVRIDGGPNVTVRLNRAQAVAFKDKFEPVDEKAAFEVASESRPRSASQGTDVHNLAKDTEGGPQGKPVVAPPETSPRRRATDVPLDPTTLEPARQGQQTREQRAIVDSGNAPPATYKVDPKEASETLKGQQPASGAPTPVPVGTGGDRGDVKQTNIPSTPVPGSVTGQTPANATPTAQPTQTKK